MPIDPTLRLSCSEIIVDRENRQRRAIDVSDIIGSIKRNGVINPIIISEDKVLIAGERRLAASIALDLPDIPVRYFASLSYLDQQIIELEENLKRKDLTWQEQTSGINRIHELFLNRNADWTAKQTSEELNLSEGTLSVYLKVASNMGLPNVQAARTVREAYNSLLRTDQRKAGEAIQQLIDDLAGPLPATSDDTELDRGTDSPTLAPVRQTVASQPKPEAPVLVQDFKTWITEYTGPKFNLIHCDFPYGIGVFDGRQGRAGDQVAGYDDSPDTFFELLQVLCTNLDRVMSISAHLMFWFGQQHGTAVRQLFEAQAPSLVFNSHPLIWLKSDGSGISPDPRRRPRHVYETCLLASRGDRHLVKVAADAYTCPTDRSLHPSTKPEPMLRHFMGMLVDETTVMLDPTCGSGTSLRAAESLGAKSVLGLELDENYAKSANSAILSARTLRHANLLARIDGPTRMELPE